jgi:two-component system sensor kinase FixL
LALELDSNLPPVRGDRVQLQQVLLNLILNGLEAMGDGVGGDGKLVIQTDLGGGGTVRVAVRDSGVGIPENTLDRVFEPFYSTKPAGMGMGLSITRSILEAHGGRIWAANNPDRGASIWFTLPAHDRPTP